MNVSKQLSNTGNFSQQISLPLDGDVRPKPAGKTDEQLSSFNTVLARIRAETAQLLDAAIALSNHPYEDLAQVPTELIKQSRLLVFEHENNAARQATPTETRPSKTTSNSQQSRLYKPWTEERKLRNRGRKLNERIGKKYSIPALLHPELQAAALNNPEYYGVCPLPSETMCVVKPDQRLNWIRADEAKALEAILREQERR